MKKLTVLALLLSFLVPSVLALQPGLMPAGVGAKYVAMGGAGSAIVDDICSAYYNPAGIVKTGNVELKIGAGAATDAMNDLMSQNAVNSPDIKLPDASGIDHTLSSLRGKTVLLQFWASKDRTCRIQNQMLVELYAKFKHRGFEIYMVSIDDDHAAWAAAILEDQLTWINVGDMKGSTSALMNYNIHNIPANYLLDKEGKIIGKNMGGPELNATLSKVL